MALARLTACIFVTSFSVVDLILSALFLFRNDRMSLKGGRLWTRFDIQTSQIDHCLLVLIRLSILIGGLVGVCWNPKAGVERVKTATLGIACICLAMTVYSPFKLLALAETTDSFRLPWFWSLFAWNMVASIVCVPIWSIGLSSVEVKAPATVIVDAANGDVSSDIERLIENEVTEHGSSPSRDASEGVANGTPKKDDEETKKVRVKEATSLFWRLIKYTTREWIWYTFGFIFLFGYSAGKSCSRFTRDCSANSLSARIFIPYFTGRVISDVVVERSYSRLVHSVLIMGSLALAR